MVEHPPYYQAEAIRATEAALLRFRLVVPVGAVALWALACGATVRAPLLSVPLPAVAFVLYAEGSLATLHRAVFEQGGNDAIVDLPEGLLLLWTFVLTVAAQVGLAIRAVLWKRRRD